MRHVRLVAYEDPCLGDTGLIVKGMRLGDGSYPVAMYQGLGVAHDLLEHQNGVEKIGFVDDELEALGGGWFVRGQHGTFARKYDGSRYSADQITGFEVAELANYWGRGANFKTPVPRTRPHDYDDDFREIIQHARNAANGDDYDFVDDEYYSAALHYLRAGFNKAQRRFRGIGMWAYEQFWAIADAVDPVLKHIEYEGQEFRLSYGDCRAYCEEIEPDWY